MALITRKLWNSLWPCQCGQGKEEEIKEEDEREKEKDGRKEEKEKTGCYSDVATTRTSYPYT